MIPRMFQRLSALALLACIALLAPAQAATRAWLDRDRIELGETATLNVETDQDNAQAPDFSELVPDFVLSGQSSNRSFELVNGAQRTRVLYAVALKPRREGVVTVPALQVGGESTAPLQLTVVPASVAPARSGEPVFIEGEADTRDPYVQQSIGYVLRLYYATPLVSGQLDQPEPDGASMQRIGSDLQFSRDIGGRRYTVVERRFLIVPERSGALTIPGARFEGRGVGGFFDDVFGNGSRNLSANGAPRTLQVRPMPDGAPQPWLPLHGLELRYQDTPQVLRAGEAATVVVEMTALGAAASQLPELQLAAVDGAQVFPEPPQVDETFDSGRLRTRVTRRFSIVPDREGSLRIAGPRQAWWDVSAATARTASLPDLNLTVEAGTGGAAARDGGVFDMPAMRMPAAVLERSPAGLWAWLALAFAALWLGTLAWALRGRRSGQAGFGQRREPPDLPDATRIATISLRELQRVLQTGDPAEVERALCALASPHVADLDALARQMDDPAQRAAIAQWQQARWAGGDVVAARASLRDAFAQGPRWREADAGADAAGQLLPPLYPRRRVRGGPRQFAKLRRIPQPEPQSMTDPKPGAKAPMPLHWKIGIGFIVGLALGLVVHYGVGGDAGWVQSFTRYITTPFSQLFLSLIFMLIVPLLFSALVVGVSEMGDIASLGRIGWRTLAYTVVLSGAAVLLGLLMVNLFKPGAGVDPALAQQLLAEGAERTAAIVRDSTTQPKGMEMLLSIVPQNVVGAASNNANILALMFFAMMFGIGLVLTRTPQTDVLKRGIEGLFEVSMTLIGLVIRLAPYAVFCFMFNLAALFGWDLLVKLGAYVLVVVGALAIHMLVVYSLALYAVAGWSPLAFFKGVQEAMLMAFSTASSNATLPTALKVADENLKLPKKVSRFVLTVGATANQNGTALFEGVTVIFLAQFFGVELSLTQQVVVMLVCILGGIGTAGVPSGSLPVVALICAMVGVPPEGIGLVLGVNHFLDMCRTTVNVTGDLGIAALVSRGEKDGPEPAVAGPGAN